MSTTGNIRTFRHYVPPFTGWFYKSTGNDESDRVNLYDLLTGAQYPVSINTGSVFPPDIDVSGSNTGTFTGVITDLVDDLDSTFYDNSATNPKWFEIKLERPIENASIKFCSPSGSNFSNVKIILKDRAGATLYTRDDSANNTDYVSQEYDWPLTAWCTARVEFHTADPVAINWALIEKSSPIHIHTKHIDELNSTIVALDADATWTGQWVSTQNFVQLIVNVLTDKDSATDGLVIELSDDGITVDHSHAYDILANTPRGHHYPSETELKFYRVKYTNGTETQNTFRLFSTLFTTMVEEGHAHGLNYALQDDHPAPVYRAILTVKKPNGDYVNVQGTTLGNLKVALEELETQVQEDLKLYVAGTGSNGAVTLTNANTAYAVPAAAPTTSYRITLYNGSDTSIFLGYEDSNANGIELPPGDSAEDDLGADQQLYAYCASAGKAITYSYKEVI